MDVSTRLNGWKLAWLSQPCQHRCDKKKYVAENKKKAQITVGIR